MHEEFVYDRHVRSVIRKITDRSIVGLEKYGTTLERDDYNLIDWLKEAQAEAMDFALYCEAAMSRIRKDGESKLQDQVPVKKEVDKDLHVGRKTSIVTGNNPASSKKCRGLFERACELGYKMNYPISAKELDKCSLDSREINMEYLFLENWLKRNYNIYLLVKLDSIMPSTYYYVVMFFDENKMLYTSEDPYIELATNRGDSIDTYDEARYISFSKALMHIQDLRNNNSPLFLKDSI
jgi:hypothetical protein